MDDAVDRQVRAYNERDVDEFVDCYGRADGGAHAVAIYRLDGDGLIDRVRFLR